MAPPRALTRWCAVLATLGERERGPEHLEQVVAAYAEALKERTRARVPLDWAETQNNLGHAIQILRERDLPAFFGPVITGEQRQLKFVVRLRVLPCRREPALLASARRHPSQP